MSADERSDSGERGDSGGRGERGERGESATDDLEVTGLAGLPGGGELSYQVRRGSEEGPPILLLRPLGGTTALWGPFREALSGRFRVISFDPRGVGRSSDPEALHSTRQMAEDAILLLDHLGVAKAHVFGLSLGGMAAMRLAIDAPDRVARLVLASTTDRGIDASHAGIRRGISFAACLVRPAALIEQCMTMRILSRRFRRERSDEVDRIMSIVGAAPMSRANILKLIAAAARHDARSELHRLLCPTLVLAAKDDPLLDVESQAALAARIQGALFDVISPSGHDMSLEQPVATAARVAEFLNG